MRSHYSDPSSLAVFNQKRIYKYQGRRFRFWLGGGGGQIKIIVAEGDAAATGGAARRRRRRRGGVWGRSVPSPKKIFADLSPKEAILKHSKMIISLLYFNIIVNIIKVLKTNFLKLYTEH